MATSPQNVQKILQTISSVATQVYMEQIQINRVIALFI